MKLTAVKVDVVEGNGQRGRAGDVTGYSRGAGWIHMQGETKRCALIIKKKFTKNMHFKTLPNIRDN